MANIAATLNKLTAPDLLNLIDRLHEIGIQDEIPLPQIIVIGSQSSGKSSVLEAISRLSFPRGQGLTTTFATEIALRKSEEISIRARIIPDKSQGFRRNVPARSKSQQGNISSWSRTLTELNSEDVAKLVTDARDVINQNSTRGPMSFSFDKLRIEASGPNFPLLTLIDLPGLILTANDNQTKQDVLDAEEIVRIYAKNEQSLMLAIISAETELVNQKALELTSEFDPTGNRTIGVITKPDILPPGHERIDYFIRCARGEVDQRRLQHGWFVLKNRNFDAGSQTADQRDSSEAIFFENSAWGDVGSHRTGVDRLRTTLSRLQETSVRDALPNVIQQIDDKLFVCDSECEKLGPGRAEERDKRHYLDRIAMDFSQIVQQAVHIQCPLHEFFQKTAENEPRELRAVLSKMYDAFVADMVHNGRTTVIVDDQRAFEAVKKDYPDTQEILSTKAMLDRIKAMDEDHRGFTLGGIVDQYRLVELLFKEQTAKWEAIALSHVNKIYSMVVSHLCLVANHLASKDTANKITTKLIMKPMNQKRLQMIAKVREVVAPHREWRPITRNTAHWDLVYNRGSSTLSHVETGDHAPLLEVQANLGYALTLNHLEAYYKVITTPASNVQANAISHHSPRSSTMSSSSQWR